MGFSVRHFGFWVLFHAVFVHSLLFQTLRRGDAEISCLESEREIWRVKRPTGVFDVCHRLTCQPNLCVLRMFSIEWNDSLRLSVSAFFIIKALQSLTILKNISSTIKIVAEYLGMVYLCRSIRKELRVESEKFDTASCLVNLLTRQLKNSKTWI